MKNRRWENNKLVRVLSVTRKMNIADNGDIIILYDLNYGGETLSDLSIDKLKKMFDMLSDIIKEGTIL